MAERKIVPGRVVRVEPREGLGDLDRGAPGDVAAPGEAEVPREPVDVDVDGDDQPVGRDGPKAEIDAVGLAHHPPREEEQALGGTPGAGIAEQVGRTASPARVAFARRGEPSGAADAVAKARERLAERLGAAVGVRGAGGVGVRQGVGVGQIADERGSERAELALDAARADEETGEILSAEEAVLEAREALAERGRALGGERWAWSDAVEELVELAEDGPHVPERAARGGERDELAVERIVVAMRERHRIVLAAGAEIGAGSHRVEGRVDGAMARVGVARAADAAGVTDQSDTSSSVSGSADGSAGSGLFAFSPARDAGRRERVAEISARRALAISSHRSLLALSASAWRT